MEDGADNPKTWIKLRPSSSDGRNITDRITVDDGKIYMEVTANEGTASRNGLVYLTTIKLLIILPVSVPHSVLRLISLRKVKRLSQIKVM